MDAVPMVQRCMELQNDAIEPPGLPLPVIERLPPSLDSYPLNEWCDRCQINHGAPAYVLWEPPAPPMDVGPYA